MLNSEQMAAVRYIDGPLLVLAGAGSGKTRVITQKIAWLIDECGYPAHSLYAVTFTNKAANEMRARIASTVTASKRKGLKVATFHTLGLQIIKKELSHCGLRKGFSIFDSEDCQQVLRSLLPPGRANDALMPVQQQISLWKNELLSPEEAAGHIPETAIGREAYSIYPAYQKALAAYNAVDFDDLIYIPVRLLTKSNEICTRWQNKIRHLLIDEYQDSNVSQYQLVKLLTGISARFTVVGDDDQSIYAWRGARPENLARLQNDYPSLKIVKLEQNYRSTGRILHAANTLIANNPHIFTKKLWSEWGPGENLRVLCCRDEQDEAEQVVTDLISHKLQTGKKYGDYAILYRGNHQSRVFEKVLRHYGIQYRLSGGQSWFARAEVKDVFAYLKLLCNEADDAAFLRAVNTPKRGIGSTSLEALGHYAERRGQSLYMCADHLALGSQITEQPRQALAAFKSWLEDVKQRIAIGPILKVLQDMVQESAYESYIYEQCDSPAQAQKRMDNVWELLEWVDRLLTKKPDQSLTDVINKLILLDILEQSDEGGDDNVQLMTLHASKGLEFPHVYLSGMEEELLPHKVSIEEDSLEEERRLAYVGITRAKLSLCFSLAKQRRRAGELQDCQPSRFLEELPKDSLEWYGKSGERNEVQSKNLAKNHLQGLKEMLG